MILILTLSTFLIFYPQPNSASRPTLSEFGNYHSLNKALTYPSGFKNNFDISGTRTYSVHPISKTTVFSFQLGSILAGSRFSELLFHKDGKIEIGTKSPDRELVTQGIFLTKEIKAALNTQLADSIFAPRFFL